MTKIFKNKSKTLFVSKADHIHARGKYAVILSPEFYWIKKVQLPVKKAKDALRLAASVYEGSLPQGDFSYAARKVEEGFIMIAYDKKEIASILEKIIPYKGDITSVHFTQDALSHIESCIAVSGFAALTNIDGIIVQVPRACTTTEHTLDEILQEADVSKNKVKLSSFDNELFSLSDLKPIAAIFLLLLFAFIAEYIVYKKASNDLESQRTQIIADNHLPRTSIQLKSIKKSLHKKYKTQKSLRETFASLSKVTLEKGEYIQSVEQTSKELLVEIHLINKAREADIKKSFAKLVPVQDAHLENNTLKLKIRS